MSVSSYTNLNFFRINVLCITTDLTNSEHGRWHIFAGKLGFLAPFFSVIEL
jgi:hypothetical protein